VIERDLVWSWPCEQLKLPQQRRRDHGVGDFDLQSTNYYVSLVLFLLYLLVLLCFRVISCGVLYCLVDIVYIHL
jgi:hypothetical protein